jgi:hypothetical protein
MTSIEQWGIFDLSVDGPSVGNPFLDVTLEGTFTHGDTSVTVGGFYDGEGVYRVRFMPDKPGRWAYELYGLPLPENRRSGEFECVSAGADNHGPVRVRDGWRFEHADGLPYRPYGTTCYAWTYQTPETRYRTLASLATSPFNKLRMCLFPKNYSFNLDEPDRLPFRRDATGRPDLTRFDPAFFHDLEDQLTALQRLGVECDLILFHPYDKGRWGFDRMDPAEDERYLRYVIARLGAYRNVWWSLANEYDFMDAKIVTDWDRAFGLVEELDPYRHLASIHNGTRMYDPDSLHLYDQSRPSVSHVSLQHWDLNLAGHWRRRWGKPVVVDECGYEGNLPQRWGNLTARMVVNMFWTGFVHGVYVGHGETYLRDDGVIWWSHGGDLVGESPARIEFLRWVMDLLPESAAPLEAYYDAPTMGLAGELYLQYFGDHRPAYREIVLPHDRAFTVDVIDTWKMTVDRLAGTFTGPSRIDLPGAANLAILVRAV